MIYVILMFGRRCGDWCEPSKCRGKLLRLQQCIAPTALTRITQPRNGSYLCRDV